MPVSGHPGLLRCEGRHTPRPAGDVRALGGSRLPAGSPALSRAASAPDANARMGAALGKRGYPEASLSPAPRCMTCMDLVPSAAGRRRPAPACRRDGVWEGLPAPWSCPAQAQASRRCVVQSRFCAARAGGRPPRPPGLPERVQRGRRHHGLLPARGHQRASLLGLSRQRARASAATPSDRATGGVEKNCVRGLFKGTWQYSSHDCQSAWGFGCASRHSAHGAAASNVFQLLGLISLIRGLQEYVSMLDVPGSHSHHAVLKPPAVMAVAAGAQ